jgi:hypothetical protein
MTFLGGDINGSGKTLESWIGARSDKESANERAKGSEESKA